MQADHSFSFRRSRHHHYSVTAFDRHEQELASRHVIGRGGVAEARRSFSRQFRGRIGAFRIVNETTNMERTERRAGGTLGGGFPCQMVNTPNWLHHCQDEGDQYEQS